MNVFEITSRAYQRRPGKSPSLKFRCTYGPRKGQVRASPAACNAPLNIKANTFPISVMLSSIIISAAPTYKAAIKGTIFSVTLAIDFIPVL